MKPRVSGSAGFLGAVLALTAAAFPLLSGCMGGTSTEAGNPGLTLEIKDGDRTAAFTGWVQFYVQGSNPRLFATAPDDGTTPPPRFSILDDAGSNFNLDGESRHTFSRDDIVRMLYARANLPLSKASAAARIRALPDFNVVLVGSDSTAGWLGGVHSDTLTGRFRGLDGSADTLVIQVSRERAYQGSVDTASPAGRPLLLFVPGTSYYAMVHGDSFAFAGIPAGKLPLRWISPNGRIHEMRDSLGVPWTGSLQPGALIDSIAVPPVAPTLAPPVAAPAGQYAFTDTVSISLSAEPGAAIYYTLNGSTPDQGSPRYASPFVLRSSATLKAVAYLKGRNHSPISVNNYLLVPAAPVATPAGRAFRDSLVVALAAKSPGASIYYTLDGGKPSEADILYTGPLILKASANLKAVADVPGLGRSPVLDEKYVLVTDSAAAPQN